MPPKGGLCNSRLTHGDGGCASVRVASWTLITSGVRGRFAGCDGWEGEAPLMLRDWLPFLIYGLMALAIPASMIVMSCVFAQRPARRTRARTIPFESGVSQGQMKPQRYTVSFYLTAMLFIVFDIEIVFLYPLAVQLHALGWFGFVEFTFFIVILLVAYVYIWRKGALEW